MDILYKKPACFSIRLKYSDVLFHIFCFFHRKIVQQRFTCQNMYVFFVHFSYRIYLLNLPKSKASQSTEETVNPSDSLLINALLSNVFNKPPQQFLPALLIFLIQFQIFFISAAEFHPIQDIQNIFSRCEKHRTPEFHHFFLPRRI